MCLCVHTDQDLIVELNWYPHMLFSFLLYLGSSWLLQRQHMLLESSQNSLLILNISSVFQSSILLVFCYRHYYFTATISHAAVL